MRETDTTTGRRDVAKATHKKSQELETGANESQARVTWVTAAPQTASPTAGRGPRTEPTSTRFGKGCHNNPAAVQSLETRMTVSRHPGKATVGETTRESGLPQFRPNPHPGQSLASLAVSSQQTVLVLMVTRRNLCRPPRSPLGLSPWGADGKEEESIMNSLKELN
jgi:hypothetical protein